VLYVEIDSSPGVYQPIDNA